MTKGWRLSVCILGALVALYWGAWWPFIVAVIVALIADDPWANWDGGY